MRLRPLLLVLLLCTSFWSLVIFMFVGIGFSGSRGGEKPFTPSSVGNLQLWLDASDGSFDASGNQIVVDGQSVQIWKDKSSNSAHAVQANIAKQPILRTGANGLNGKPVLEFTSASQMHMVTSNVSLRGLTAFMVFSSTNTSSFLWMLGKTGGQPTAGGAHWYRDVDDGQGARYAGVFQKGSGKVIAHGALVTGLVELRL